MDDVFNFYYDENGHTRVISKNAIADKNFYLYFCASIVGWKKLNEDLIRKKYEEFELKYKKIYCCEELKSTVIKMKKYEYGIYGFNQIDLNFLNDYCDFLLNDNIYVYFSIINKIHLLVSKAIANSNTRLRTQEAAYTISKLLVVHKPKKVLEALYNEDQNAFFIELRSFLNRLFNQNKNRLIKESENIAIFQLLMELDKIHPPKNFDFIYLMIFEGFSLFIKDLKINNQVLFIDKEGSGKTISSALYFDLKSKEIDSASNFGIRCADIAAGIFGRLINGMVESLEYKDENEMKNLKFLPIEWFEIDKNRFNILKKLRKILVTKNNVWNKVYTSDYSDHPLYLLCYLDYIEKFHNYETYRRVDNVTHQKTLNQHMVQTLRNRFRDLNFQTY